MRPERKLLLAVVAVAALPSSPVRAETIEVPLSGVLGTYSGELGDQRTVTVVLPMRPSAIHGVALRLGGESTLGDVMCEGSNGLEPFPWPMDLGGSFAAEGGVWIASPRVPEQSGSFTSTDSFRAIPPGGPTWSFLMDGEATLSFYGVGAALVGTCFDVLAFPAASLDQAVLVVDAEFPLPVARSTWGGIKALYR